MRKLHVKFRERNIIYYKEQIDFIQTAFDEGTKCLPGNIKFAPQLSLQYGWIKFCFKIVTVQLIIK